MTTVKEHHDRAMDLAFWAGLERQHNPALREQLFRMALQEELKALTLLGTRSEQLADGILHRSAAWLALNSGQPQLAWELANRPLQFNPENPFAAELREVRALARQALENPRQPIPEQGYYPALAWTAEPGACAAGAKTNTPAPAAENPLPEHKNMKYPPKTYASQAKAQEDLESLQMHAGFENAFLLGGWNAAGQPEWLLGIYAPRLGRMLLIDEDHLEARQIDRWEQAAAAATEE